MTPDRRSTEVNRRARNASAVHHGAGPAWDRSSGVLPRPTSPASSAP